MITGGFGVTMDLERGMERAWYVSRDGVKRWAATDQPVEQAPVVKESLTTETTPP